MVSSRIFEGFDVTSILPGQISRVALSAEYTGRLQCGLILRGTTIAVSTSAGSDL